MIGEKIQGTLLAFAVALSISQMAWASENQASSRVSTFVNPPQALTLTSQAMTLKEAGRLREAEAKFKAAQQIFEQEKSGSSYYVRCLYNLANVYAAQDKNGEAELSYRQILAIKARVGWVDYLDSIYRELGLICVKERKLTDANYWFAQHLALHSKNPSLEASDCDGIGLALNQLHQPKLALTYYEKAKTLRQSVRPVDDLATCERLTGLATAETELGHYSKAEQLLLEAKKIADVKKSAELSVPILRAYSQLAKLTNRAALAEKLQQEANQMMQSQMGL